MGDWEARSCTDEMRRVADGGTVKKVTALGSPEFPRSPGVHADQSATGILVGYRDVTGDTGAGLRSGSVHQPEVLIC